MIQVDKLTKYFGPVMAIDNVSFEVERGEIVGFLGPNGAGKSTTMRILTTYMPATSGIAKVAGYDVMTESLDVRKNLGYLPESVPLYPEMRVEEYLDFRAKIKGVGRKERPMRLEYCIERCRVREVRRRQIGTLSKGYRQRVGLADAMIHDPPILILDEPTAGLDPIQIRETLALIQELGESHTILLSTHILTEVEAVCERVIIINSGRIGLQATLESLEAEVAILVEVRGDPEHAGRVLREVGGVVSADIYRVEDGIVGYEVKTHQDEDLREKISQVLLKQHLPLRRLELKRRRLEDAFFEVLRAYDPLKEGARPASSTAVTDLSKEEAVTE